MDGSTETQEELIERLLNYYFPTRNQANIFDLLEGEKKKEDLVREAYILRNKDIADIFYLSCKRPWSIMKKSLSFLKRRYSYPVRRDMF
ncbi:MAG: hypothetical protein AB1420_03600 [Bacillota bacterium]